MEDSDIDRKLIISTWCQMHSHLPWWRWEKAKRSMCLTSLSSRTFHADIVSVWFILFRIPLSVLRLPPPLAHFRPFSVMPASTRRASTDRGPWSPLDRNLEWAKMEILRFHHNHETCATSIGPILGQVTEYEKRNTTCQIQQWKEVMFIVISKHIITFSL